MQTFKYKAVSRDGAKVTGIVEAFDEYAAVTKVRETCSVVTSIDRVQNRTTQEKKELVLGKISEKSLAVMCSQFSIILSAGLPIVRAVELIADQTSDRALRRILKEAAGDVAAGFGLAQSFESKGKNLPTTFIETVRSGEESGTLEESFKRLHAYYDKSYKTRGKVKSAMVYPVFTIVVAVIVVAIIMVVAVPTFTSSFASMGVELPGVTKALIALSDFFVHWWLLLAVIISGGILGWKLWGRTEKGRLWQHRRQLDIPVLGKLAEMKAASQFANTMSTLLSAGLSMVKAVNVTAKIMDNYWIGTELSRQLPKLEEGRTLGSCLKAAGVLPALLVEMTAVGEETGTMESTLDVVGSYYDNETEMASQKALSLLEPVVICFLAGIVCFILLSVYLPMFSLYGNIG
jgi:type IV pilus assembly protein PilC